MSLVKELERNETYRKLTSDLGGEEEFEVFSDAFKRSELKLTNEDFKSTLESMREILKSQTAKSLKQKESVEVRIIRALEDQKEEENTTGFKKRKEQLADLLKRYDERMGLSGESEEDRLVSQDLVDKIGDLLKNLQE